MKNLLKQLTELTDEIEGTPDYRIVPVENFEKVILILFFTLPDFHHTKRYIYHAYDYVVGNELITWADTDNMIKIDLNYIEHLCQIKNY